MIDIYICEDVKEERKIIVRYIEAAVLIEEYDMRIKLATNQPEELLCSLEKSKNTGLYFLDIDLKSNKNGLEIAKEIREHDPRGFIIFITSHSEMAFLTFKYKVEALDFIVKDEPQQLQNRIHDCIKNVNDKNMNITRGNKKTMTITKGGRKITLEYSDILFFETSGNDHKLMVHTFNKSIEFFGNMKEIEKQVGKDFVRSHRAYLINKKNIKQIIYDDKSIIMKNETKCPISHRMFGQVKKQLL